MNSQALQQSDSENRWSHRLGLLDLVMFNGIIQRNLYYCIKYVYFTQ